MNLTLNLLSSLVLLSLLRIGGDIFTGSYELTKVLPLTSMAIITTLIAGSLALSFYFGMGDGDRDDIK